MIINCKSLTSPYIQRDDSVTAYFNDIRRFPLLTKEQEREMLRLSRYGDEHQRRKAIETLVTHNQRFVISAAMKFANGDNVLDLVNEGNIGLMAAIENFDMTKDVKFITYAVWWIQKYMTAFITNYTNIVVPANANKLRTLTSKIRKEFFVKEMRNPTLEEIQHILIEKYGFRVENLAELAIFQSYSLSDKTSTTEESGTFEDDMMFTNVTATNNVEDDTEQSDRKEIVSKLLDHLNKKDRYIIEKAFGIGCAEETYETIGKTLGLSKERIRQKVKEITAKMARYSID